jgi:hypothetical protein
MKIKQEWKVVIVIGLIVSTIIYFIKVKKTSSLGDLINGEIIQKSLDPRKEDVKLYNDFNFELIPDSLNNYRSAQILAVDLPNLIKKYKIKRIIRMNGNGVNDQAHRSKYKKVSMEEEKKICEDNDCEFFFINSHEGYQTNKGYVTSLNKINNILVKGNALIHCAHGQDRTGGMVGGYLKKNLHITDLDKLWLYTTVKPANPYDKTSKQSTKNGWQKRAYEGNFFGTGYDLYADTFYPLNLLKKSKWVKK